MGHCVCVCVIWALFAPWHWHRITQVVTCLLRHHQFHNTSNAVAVNSQGCLSATALHMAIERDHVPVAKFLLQNGASLNVLDASGRKPEHLARSTAMKGMMEAFTAPPKRYAVYTHTNGERERVEVVKEHSEAEGGGFTIFVPSLGRERQTLKERLDLTSNAVSGGTSQGGGVGVGRGEVSLSAQASGAIKVAVPTAGGDEDGHNAGAQQDDEASEGLATPPNSQHSAVEGMQPPSRRFQEDALPCTTVLACRCKGLTDRVRVHEALDAELAQNGAFASEMAMWCLGDLFTELARTLAREAAQFLHASTAMASQTTLQGAVVGPREVALAMESVLDVQAAAEALASAKARLVLTPKDVAQTAFLFGGATGLTFDDASLLAITEHVRRIMAAVLNEAASLARGVAAEGRSSGDEAQGTAATAAKSKGLEVTANHVRLAVRSLPWRSLSPFPTMEFLGNLVDHELTPKTAAYHTWLRSLQVVTATQRASNGGGRDVVLANRIRGLLVPASASPSDGDGEPRGRGWRLEVTKAKPAGAGGSSTLEEDLARSVLLVAGRAGCVVMDVEAQAWLVAQTLRVSKEIFDTISRAWTVEVAVTEAQVVRLVGRVLPVSLCGVGRFASEALLRRDDDPEPNVNGEGEGRAGGGGAGGDGDSDGLQRLLSDEDKNDINVQNMLLSTFAALQTSEPSFTACLEYMHSLQQFKTGIFKVGLMQRVFGAGGEVRGDGGIGIGGAFMFALVGAVVESALSSVVMGALESVLEAAAEAKDGAPGPFVVGASDLARAWGGKLL